MKSRNTLAALGTTMILGAPLAAFADFTWIAANDEAGTRIVITRDDPATIRIGPLATKALGLGDISPDRQYVFLGGEGGWQIRSAEYRFERGRLVHVEDPDNYMKRISDNRPLMAEQGAALDHVHVEDPDNYSPG